MMYRIIIALINASWIVLAIAGLAVAFLGYKQGEKKSAFILFILYFAGCLYTHTIATPITNWWASINTSSITQEQLEQYSAMEQEVKALYLKYPEASPGVSISYFNYPLGQILLVIGLWLIVKKRKKAQAVAGYPPQGVGSPARDVG